MRPFMFMMVCTGLLFCAAGTDAAQMGKPAPPPPPGPVTLDLDPAPGDQGKREVQGVQPGATVTVEVVALTRARYRKRGEMRSFEAQIRVVLKRQGHAGR